MSPVLFWSPSSIAFPRDYFLALNNPVEFLLLYTPVSVGTLWWLCVLASFHPTTRIRNSSSSPSRKSGSRYLGNNKTTKDLLVSFFTFTHFLSRKFYTQKCVNLRQKRPRNKTVYINILCKITHCVFKTAHHPRLQGDYTGHGKTPSWF